MHTGVASARSDATTAPTTRLDRFLNAYWLRPENAFWMTIRSRTLDDVPFEPPSIDLSCGDGIFTFLHLGGVLDPDFDVFGTVAHLDRVQGRHADMFDHCDAGYRPRVARRPPVIVSVGTDWKPALLAKAETLGLYERLLEHDGNRPLPLDDAAFQTVYCNAAYWLDNVEGFLREIARITRPGGRVVLQVKLDSLKRYTLERHRSVLGDTVLDIIGRGRVQSWPSLTDRRGWESRFAAAGLEIRAATPFITETHAHIWDIGLRPIAPMLVKMANGLTPQTRAGIKRDWVALFRELLTPLCRPDFSLRSRPDEPAEIQYVLEPC